VSDAEVIANLREQIGALIKQRNEAQSRVFELEGSTIEGLRLWARDQARLAFRVHHRVIGSWYGPRGITPTDTDREIAKLSGEAGTALQSLYHALGGPQ
jgi:hypothetical protein